MHKHIKEYFVCPHCGSPRYLKEKIQESVNRGCSYCGRCGKELASALAEALAEVQREG